MLVIVSETLARRAKSCVFVIKIEELVWPERHADYLNYSTTVGYSDRRVSNPLLSRACYSF